jgi:GT2 family glycosyltransferase
MNEKLTIQIVGWNSADVLESGLIALKTIPQDEVLVRYIDNGSNDDSVLLVKKHLPQADIIELSKNKGFSAAHNIGLKRCDTPYVLLHDPDVTVEWAGIKELISELDNEKNIGAVQGKLFRVESNKKLIDSAGIELTLALNGRERGANEVDEGQYEKKEYILAATGSCVLFRMKSLHNVKYGESEFFDEKFFAYKEDVDLGWRLNNAGWKVKYVPVDVGVHRRTLGKRGFMNWGLNPIKVLARLRNPRTRYSFRNWIWLIVKNASFKQGLLHEVFVDLRILVFLILSCFYWPLFTVWGEVWRGLPLMMKRRNSSFNKV